MGKGKLILGLCLVETSPQSHMFEEDNLFPIQLWSRDCSIITQEISQEVGFAVTMFDSGGEKKKRKSGFQNQKNKMMGLQIPQVLK